MKNRSKGGNSSGAPRSGRAPDWAMRMKFFNPGKTPTRIRLIPYTPEQLWFTYYSKWIKITDSKTGKQVSRNVVGNSHNGQREVPDLLYYYAIETQRVDLMASESQAVTVVVLEDFHEVEKGKSKAGNPYYDYVRCAGKNRFGQSVCEHCSQGVKKVFGQKLHWSLWPSAKKALEQQLLELGSRCVSCTKGIVSVYGYTCQSCGGQLANHYDKMISPEIEQHLQTEETECPHCGKTGMAGQLVECVIRHGDGDDATFSEGCGNPKRPEAVEDLWGYDLTVVEETVGKASKVVITGFNPSEKGPEIGAELSTPFDFLFFDRMTLEDQVKAMGRPVPKEWGDERAVQGLIDQYFQENVASQETVDPNQADSESVPWSK